MQSSIEKEKFILSLKLRKIKDEKKNKKGGKRQVIGVTRVTLTRKFFSKVGWSPTLIHTHTQVDYTNLECKGCLVYTLIGHSIGRNNWKIRVENG